ncbi:GNAT family N-acetyltransferase [Evansella clarkii]|uniref:GNAT family N-acetyltransferase n=1 Tax=Evansella clarkii TaxID=79879 RepID=UPI000B4448E5|nr:GNAT family N-acetyltransferase [Evansella clarkii]
MIKKEKAPLTLVQFENKDISGLVELSASVGWDYDEQEIGTVMASGKIFGHKNAEGKIVSSAAIIKYDGNLASIGMVIVNNDFRGLGLGKEVTQKCIDYFSNELSVMLIATAEGKPLYKKMGFKAVDSVHKFLCDTYDVTKSIVNNNFTVESCTESDFNEIIKLDEAAFGNKRSHFLHQRIKQSKQCLAVKDSEGNIIGYGLSVSGPVNLILGPVVAPNTHIAALILDNLAYGHQGKLRIDVPSGNDEFMLFLENKGFVKVSTPPVMLINAAELPFRNNTLFAIAAQVFG